MSSNGKGENDAAVIRAHLSVAAYPAELQAEYERKNAERSIWPTDPMLMRLRAAMPDESPLDLMAHAVRIARLIESRTEAVV